MPKRKQSRQVGDIVKIERGDGRHWYGRVLEEPLMAFYGVETTQIENVEQIVGYQVIFKIWVMNSAITSGQWTAIGNRALEPDLQRTPPFFKQDPITNQLSICSNGEERPALLEECKNMERAAVWSPEHVEDRLRDYFSGVPNRWVESLKVKIVSS